MLVEIKREILSTKSTIGELFVNGVYKCKTLELPVRDGLPGSAIPPTGDASSYLVKLLPSAKFSASHDPWVMTQASTVPHILGLPPTRSNILMHWGNTAKDTDGCILLGLVEEVPDAIGSSRSAYSVVRVLLGEAEDRGEPIHLRIYGGTPHTPSNRDTVAEITSD